MQGGVQGTLELSLKDKDLAKGREGCFRAGTVSSRTGLSLASLRRSEVARGTGEGGWEAPGAHPQVLWALGRSLGFTLRALMGWGRPKGAVITFSCLIFLPPPA